MIYPDEVERRGWCPATVGNLSVRNSNLKWIYIKRTGADLNRIKLQDILTLDLDGNILEGKENRP